MTPKPPPAILELVRLALKRAQQNQELEPETVALVVGVPLPAALRLIALVRGLDVPPTPPRSLDR